MSATLYLICKFSLPFSFNIISALQYKALGISSKSLLFIIFKIFSNLATACLPKEINKNTFTLRVERGITIVLTKRAYRQRQCQGLQYIYFIYLQSNNSINSYIALSIIYILNIHSSLFHKFRLVIIRNYIHLYMPSCN